MAFIVAMLGSACAMTSPGAEVYPELAGFSERNIAEVQFAGHDPVPTDTLERLIVTKATHCNFLFCPGGLFRSEQHLHLQTLREDVNRLALHYRQIGYFGTTVRPEVREEPGEDGVEVTFVVNRGDAIYVDSVFVEGTEGILDPDSLEAELPLQPGGLFDLRDFVASADTVLSTLRVRGHLYSEVLRNFAVDTTIDAATAWLVAVPGPRVEVDSIIVSGVDELGRGAAVRQLTFRSGDLLRASDLVNSQRNLYNLDLVQFATVTVAEDSLQRTLADSTRATVQVTISEAPRHLVETTVGYGSVDCFRTQARWVDRSFGPGARRLSLSGSLSKIGIGEPLDAGLAGSPVCEAFRDDRFGNSLDFRLSGELTQPFLFGPRNQLILSGFVERQSEPSLFQRRAEGARLAVNRRISPREALTLAADFERSRTLSSEVLFCFTFQVCRPQDVEQLAQARWRNRLIMTWLQERTDRVIDPTQGTILRLNTEWASPLLASELDFLRSNGDFAIYQPLRRGWVGAFFLRLGTFASGGNLAGDDDFLPPEDRYFAGGSNSVRGFSRNQLGPGVYVASGPGVDPRVTPDSVRFFPTGGTAVVVTSAELRVPSPFLSDILRLAVFVDAGALGTERLWDIDFGDFRVTPGAGLRLRTPVGPARLDLAYNPHDPPTGLLFVPQRDRDSPGGVGNLVPVVRRFRPPSPSFLDRLQIHIAVGQAF